MIISYSEHYSSVSAVLSRLSEPPIPEANDHSQKKATEKWDLNTGYETAVSLYRDGWIEGAAQVEQVSKTLDVVPPALPRMRFTQEVAGAFPDVPAYLASDPQNMFAPIWEDTTVPRYLSLWVPGVFNSAVHAQAALNRGIAFAALIDALEASGIRVSVTCYVYVAIAKPNSVLTSFAIKDYAEPLNLEDLIFSVAHPTMLRRIWFGIAERMPYEPMTVATRKNYGYAASLKASDIPNAEPETLTFRCLSGEEIFSPAVYLKTMLSTLPPDVRATLPREEG